MVVFVCENNLYSVQSPLSVRQPPDVTIWERSRSYGMPAARVDGNDVGAVYDAARQAVDRARSGEGPALLECLTYRWREHVGPLLDHDRGFRSKEEIDSWVARCPIKRAATRALERRACTRADLERWEGELQAEVDAAVVAAKASPFPLVEQILDGTY